MADYHDRLPIQHFYVQVNTEVLREGVPTARQYFYGPFLMVRNAERNAQGHLRSPKTLQTMADRGMFIGKHEVSIIMIPQRPIHYKTIT